MMPPTKTPIPSLTGSNTTYPTQLKLHLTTITATELFVKRIRYRTLPGIRRMCSASAFRMAPTIRPSSVNKLPQEIVERIIAHLTYDKSSLLSCSLTCYSWYIVAAAHLHHTLIVPKPVYYRSSLHHGSTWSEPLRDMHKLGLLPLVKNFKIHIDGYHYSHTFSQAQLDSRTLRHFVALSNVLELWIDYLDIPSFWSTLRRDFGHFLPTVQSLTLKKPEGSHRQIVYFIGLFQHLEDLRLLYDQGGVQGEPTNDLTLVPSFDPPLRGAGTIHESRYFD